MAPVLPWRLVAGAFVHLVLPFYLLAILVTVVRTAPVDAPALLHLVLRVSPALLAGYVATALTATLVVAAADRVLRARQVRRQTRVSRSPARRSGRRLEQAIARGASIPGPRAQAALLQLEQADWNHDDPGQQALSRDLADAIETSTRALATASPERRPALIEMVTATIEHIAAAQADLTAANAQEAEKRARIVAGYIEGKYGTSQLSD